MAKVEPTKIVVITGDNHKKSLWSAIGLLKAKITVENVDTKTGSNSSVNVQKRV